MWREQPSMNSLMWMHRRLYDDHPPSLPMLLPLPLQVMLCQLRFQCIAGCANWRLGSVRAHPCQAVC
jgi:hypothetical protein